MKTFLTKATLAALTIFTLFSCQTNESADTATAEEIENAETAGTQADRRPAPEFFVIPMELVKSRVWVCDNEVSDIFHVKNDCPVFMTCRTTKRNVSLPRAIEEYGRYNCLTCSEDLSHIFDEDMIRKEYN
jgi:hypothetical protein